MKELMYDYGSVVSEANAIGTAVLHVGLLPEPG